MNPMLIFLGIVAIAASSASWQISARLTGADWQKKWDAHIIDDLAATVKVQADQKAIQDGNDFFLAKVSEHGQIAIDVARADADASDKRSSVLQRASDDAYARLVASQSRLSACATDASKAATKAAGMYAELFKLADDAAGIMARTADQAIIRGTACESSYNQISNPNKEMK